MCHGHVAQFIGIASKESVVVGCVALGLRHGRVQSRTGARLDTVDTDRKRTMYREHIRNADRHHALTRSLRLDNGRQRDGIPQSASQ